jgi:hypothetical protein
MPASPFKRFLDYQALTDYVQSLAAARPQLCRLGSLGRSRDGREIHLMTVTDFATGAPEDRPGYLIHGNIHAGEVSGTHASLYTARQLLMDHGRSDILKRVVFYIVPRLNPDGAEHVVRTSGRIRSRTDWSEMGPNTLYQCDVNGDGLILSMRIQDPAGVFAVDPKDRRLMVRRQTGSKGPFYRVLPEGLIHDWDGTDRILSEGRGFDWNRNWSYDWRPEPEQYGAGDFPFSEPEMRHLAEFLHSRPNLFGVLGYHTGPAAVLRPPSTGGLSDLDAGDDRMMEDLAQLAASETGFPVVPVVKYHGARDRDINLRGHFHNFGYHHLGLFVYEFEMGTAKDSAGMDTEAQFAAQDEPEREAQMRRLMKWWDRHGSKYPLFSPWKPFDHPQLGAVDIGGLRFCQLANRMLPDLAKVCEGTHRFTLSHAAKHPQVGVEALTVAPVGGPVYRIRARVSNRGELPTHVTSKGRGLRRLRPVQIGFHPADRVSLLSAQGHVEVGHLAGVTGSRTLEWFVAAETPGKQLGEIRVMGGTGGNSTVPILRTSEA